MKKLSFAAVMIGGLLLTSCWGPPVACFNMSDSSPGTGQSVNFSNCSIKGGSFLWDFGDGTSSEERSPSHAWGTAGTYKVSLKVFNKKGEESEVAQNVVVE